MNTLIGKGFYKLFILTHGEEKYFIKYAFPMRDFVLKGILEISTYIFPIYSKMFNLKYQRLYFECFKAYFQYLNESYHRENHQNVHKIHIFRSKYFQIFMFNFTVILVCKDVLTLIWIGFSKM